MSFPFISTRCNYIPTNCFKIVLWFLIVKNLIYLNIFRIVEAFLEQMEAVDRKIETPLFNFLQKEVHAVTGQL